MMSNEKELYEKLKERMAVSNFIDEMQNNSYEIKKEGVFYMKKKIWQTVASLAVLFATSITVYAGVTGNLNFEKLGLLKLSKNYDENATDINQSIENDYCKITLEKVAGDSAYLITEYTIDFKEKAPKEFSQINYNETYGYNLEIAGTVNINSKTQDNIITYIDKITDSKFKYIQIINVMEIKDENLVFEKKFDEIYTGEALKESIIEVNKTLFADIKLIRTNQERFESIEQKIDKNNKIIIEEFANTKFESFIRIKQIKQDITWNEYNNTDYDSFVITDGKDESISYKVYSGEFFRRKMFVKKNGEYIQVERDYDFKDDDIVKTEENYTILLGLDVNINKIKITPARTRIYNDRTDEEEKAYNKATWYDVVAGDKKYTQKSNLGGTLVIDKIEIDDKNITFYYEKDGKIENISPIIIRKNNGIMNYIHPTEVIEKNLTGTENKIIFSRSEKYRTGLRGNEMSEEEYENMLNDLKDVQFTLLFGSITEQVGSTIELKVPNQNQENAIIENVRFVADNPQANIDNNLEISNDKKSKEFSEEEITQLALETYNKYLKLEIYQNSSIGPMPYILEELGLEEKENIDKIMQEKENYNQTYIKSHTKYKDFKNEMLKVMTEEIFNKKYSDYKDIDGYVAFCDSAAGVIPISVEDIKLISKSDNDYVFKITLKDEEMYEHYLNGEGITEQEYLSEIEEYFEYVNGYMVVSTKENKNETNQTQIEWEEYPDDLNEEVNEIIKQIYGVEEINYFGKGQKMIYSLITNKLCENNEDSILKNILYSYTDFGGDYFSKVETNSNYNQYNYLEKTNQIEKYENTIKMQTAIFNSSRKEEYTENGEIKDLTEKIKKQYEIIRAENSEEKSYYYGLDKIAIMNGNNTNEESYKNNSRAKKIKVIVNGDKEYILNLKDTNKVQLFDLDYKQESIQKPIDIEIEVLETFDGEKTKDIYISDIQFGVTTNISLGI